MLSTTLRTASVAALLVLVPFLAACGSGGSTAPADDPPVISIAGVEDGQSVEGPVTISISVSPAGATYQATLDGEAFFSGGTVSEPGAHTLAVEARNGTRTATRIVDFDITFSGESMLIIRLIDLGANDAGGGGDAILLTDSSAAGMEHFMIDAGPAGSGGSDPGYVQDRLEELGVETLEGLLLTHAHTDHFRGMPPILQGTAVGHFLYNGQIRSFSEYNSLLSLAQGRADEVIVPEGPIPYELGFGGIRTELVVLSPLPTHIDDDTNDGSDLNEGSLGTSLTRGSFRMFFTGDGEVAANRRWRTDFAALTLDLTALKVGHHGGNDAVFDPASSSTSPWLAHTDPELQVISANGTSHPLPRALGALQAQTTETYCTNVHGDIEIRVAPAGTWVVSVEKNANSDCVPAS